MKYLIKANHPILRRVDITVSDEEVGAKVSELIRSCYEIECVEPAQQSFAPDRRYCPRCEQYTIENGICLDCDVPEPPAGKA